MNEQEWMACRKRPDMMLAEVRGKVSDRKCRLFACGCAYHFWHLFTDQTKRAIEVSEMVADGRATREELDFAHRQAAHGQTEQEAWLAFQTSLPEGAIAAFCVATGPGFYKAARRGHQYSEPWGTWKNLVCSVMGDIFGNPFRPVTIDPAWLAWHDGTVPKIAQAIYDERRFAELPVLADALEEAGCADRDLLDHCRQPGPHVWGCWVVDLVLGKQ